MIVLIARYQVKSDHGDEVLAALRRMAPLVKAGEPGCKLYHVSRAQDNPDQFLLYEHYEDEAALLPGDMVELIEGGEWSLEAARAAIEWATRYGDESAIGGAVICFDMGNLAMLPPVPRPPLLRDFMGFETHRKWLGGRGAVMVSVNRPCPAVGSKLKPRSCSM